MNNGILEPRKLTSEKSQGPTFISSPSPNPAEMKQNNKQRCDPLHSGEQEGMSKKGSKGAVAYVSAERGRQGGSGALGTLQGAQ